MGQLRREAAKNPAAATLLEEIEAEDAARSDDFFTGPVKNLDRDGDMSYLPVEAIYSPVPRNNSLSGEKFGVAEAGDAADATLSGASQVATEQAVAVRGHLVAESDGVRSQAGIIHHEGEIGGEKIVACGELLILPGETPKDSLVVPRQRVRRGRPRTLDEELRCRVVSLMSVGLSLRQTAAKVGVHHTAIMAAMRRDREFAEQVSEARSESVAQPLAVVIKAARRDWRAAAWLAKHLQSQFYKGDCPPEERALERK
jgi:hypothetical protein